jgi:HAD superfamily hydrolase (TIGR01509 family)
MFDDVEMDGARTRLRCEGFRKALSEVGIALSTEELIEAHEKSAAQLQASWRRNEHLSTLDQIKLILQIASGNGIDLPRSPTALTKLENAYIDPVFRYPPVLNKEAVLTLEGMRERVRKLGIISNTGRTPGSALRLVLERFGILSFFDSVIFSDEAGCRKPHRRIFDLAASELGTGPRNIIHIGDNPEADIWGGKQAGMRAVLFECPVPEEFKRKPGSLFALSRADRQVPDSEIKPDARIQSLSEALAFVDTLT